jgi:hypothetical protein
LHESIEVNNVSKKNDWHVWTCEHAFSAKVSQFAPEEEEEQPTGTGARAKASTSAAKRGVGR